MKESDKGFTGSIPAIYDRYLGPLIFEPYAADLAERLRGLEAGRVLETACGTGIVTRALAGVLPEPVAIAATDLNQPMLDYAATKLKTGAVTWRQADAQTLPFEDGIFDRVVCQFGVMFFPDKRKAFAEARRVLKPGGRFLFNVWGPIQANDFGDLVTEAVSAMFPEDPPRFLARTPHGYHDRAIIEGDLRAVGFARIAIETLDKRSPAASPRDPAIGYCQGSPLRNEIEARDPARLEEATDRAAEAIAAHLGRGLVEGKLRALVVTATR